MNNKAKPLDRFTVAAGWITAANTLSRIGEFYTVRFYNQIQAVGCAEHQREFWMGYRRKLEHRGLNPGPVNVRPLNESELEFMMNQC